MSQTFIQHDRYADLSRTTLDALWGAMNSAEVVYAMRVVSDLGVPAVVGAEKRLLDDGLISLRRDKVDDHQARVHRCVGAMARQVMESYGYALAEKEVNLVKISRVFTHGSRYEGPKLKATP